MSSLFIGTDLLGDRNSVVSHGVWHRQAVDQGVWAECVSEWMRESAGVCLFPGLAVYLLRAQWWWHQHEYFAGLESSRWLEVRFLHIAEVPHVPLKKQAVINPLPLQWGQRSGRPAPCSVQTQRTFFQLEAFQLLWCQHVFNLSFAFVLVFCFVWGCFSIAHRTSYKRLMLC